MKYYKVQVPLGHLGSSKALPTWLYFEAENILEAVDRARSFPGVKHSKLPYQALEIKEEEYIKGIASKDYNAKMTQIFNQDKTDYEV